MVVLSSINASKEIHDAKTKAGIPLNMS